MEAAVENKTITDLEIQRATHLALVEILVGSVGHGFKIPFTGQFLSLYQLNILSQALSKDHLPRASTVEISGIVAVLKSLSPAGQKLGPMFSILAQGSMFWFGTALAGIGIAGQLIGATLLAVWAFIQPLITFIIIYGFDLVRMLQNYNQKLENEYPYARTFIIAFLVGVVVIKLVLAWTIVFMSAYRKKEWHLETEKLEGLILKKESSAVKKMPAWKRAFRDLMNPLFIISFILMVIFISQMETANSQKIWMALRPLAIAYLIFYAVRSPWVNQWLFKKFGKSKMFQGFYKKSESVMKLIESKRHA